MNLSRLERSFTGSWRIDRWDGLMYQAQPGFGCQVSEEKDRLLNSEVGMRNAEKIEVGIWNVASGPQ
jgi:hypothetical protein